jgi:hypothetical protein
MINVVYMKDTVYVNSIVHGLAEKVTESLLGTNDLESMIKQEISNAYESTDNEKEETEEKAEADSEGTKSNVLNFPTKSSDPKIN